VLFYFEIRTYWKGRFPDYRWEQLFSSSLLRPVLRGTKKTVPGIRWVFVIPVYSPAFLLFWPLVTIVQTCRQLFIWDFALRLLESGYFRVPFMYTRVGQKALPVRLNLSSHEKYCTRPIRSWLYIMMWDDSLWDLSLSAQTRLSACLGPCPLRVLTLHVPPRAFSHFR
jgi:hypothetical protein